MHEPSPSSRGPEPVVNAMGADVVHDGSDWCVTVVVDGQRRVVSRHATEALAHGAVRHLNWSANRQSGDIRG